MNDFLAVLDSLNPFAKTERKVKIFLLGYYVLGVTKVVEAHNHDWTSLWSLSFVIQTAFFYTVSLVVNKLFSEK